VPRKSKKTLEKFCKSCNFNEGKALKFGSLKLQKMLKKIRKTFKKHLTKSEKILYTPFCSLYNFYQFLADDI